MLLSSSSTPELRSSAPTKLAISVRSDGMVAFTLMELLIVIAVVSILAALLLPALNSLREGGNAGKCAANQRNILSAFMSYAADNNNDLPCYGDFSGVQKPWYEQLSPYLGGTDEKPAWAGINMMRCPSQKDKTRFATYGLNYGYSTYAPFSFTGMPPTYSGSMKLAAIHSNTYLLGDCVDPSAGGGNSVIYSPQVEGGWVFDADRDGDGVVDSCSSFVAKFNQFDPRHRKMANCGFADGSVRAVSVRQWEENGDHLWGNYKR